MVSENKKQIILEIIEERGRISYMAGRRIIQPDDQDTSKSLMSPQTYNEGLKELVRENKIIKVSDKRGNLNIVSYESQIISEDEKLQVLRFKKNLDQLHKVGKMLVEKKFKSSNWKGKDAVWKDMDGNITTTKRKRKTKKQMQHDEDSFTEIAFANLQMYNMLFKSCFELIPRTGHSKILKEGEQMFEDINQWITEIRSTYKFSEQQNFQMLWGWIRDTAEIEIEQIWSNWAEQMDITFRNLEKPKKKTTSKKQSQKKSKI